MRFALVLRTAARRERGRARARASERARDEAERSGPAARNCRGAKCAETGLGRLAEGAVAGRQGRGRAFAWPIPPHPCTLFSAPIKPGNALNVTLEQLRAGLTLATGQTHRLVLQRIRALFLQLAVDFADGSVVFDPAQSCGERSALGVMAEALKVAQANPGLFLMIVAHDASESGGLSGKRAKAMRALLQGDRNEWASGAASAHTSRDIQRLLKWAERDHGFACDPGAIDGIIGPKTKAALRRFRSSFNIEFGAHLVLSAPFGEDDFAAYSDLLDVAIARTLGTDEAGLERLRASLKVCPEPTLGCGAAFPGSSIGVAGYGSSDARIDFVYVEDTSFPSLCSQSPPGHDLYATQLRFRRECIAIAPGLRTLRLDMRILGASHYRLLLDGREQTGQVAADGSITCELGETASTGEPSVWPERFASLDEAGELGMIWELEIGTLADPGLPAGAHARLACLGYECGEPDGELSELLMSALQSFQEEHLGNASGRLDDASRSALRHQYGA
jgi:peptidoglycan hydrolase-like protein with peptidoglycan-binding domain